MQWQCREIPRLDDQAATRTLRVSDRPQIPVLDDREADKLTALFGQVVQDGLADVEQARGR